MNSGKEEIQCGTLNISTESNETSVNSSDYGYYFDGVFVSVFGIVGMLGNVLTLCVLSRKKFKDCFHKLLLTLACFDSLFILCGGINYSCRAFKAGSQVFTLLFPTFIYPFSYIGLTGSIFMTFAISIERFLGICYPLKFPPHTRKAWYYILPVVLISILINIPRFFDAVISWNEGSPSYQPSGLRMSVDYIKYYRTYFYITFSALMPFLSIFFLNARIIWDLQHVKAQRFGSSKKLKKEINLFLILLSIVVTFLFLHSPRIIVDIYEFLNVEEVAVCQEAGVYFRPIEFIKTLTYISHFTTIINSGVNFLIYSFVGNSFRKEFFKMIGLRVRDGGQRTVMMEVSQRIIHQEYEQPGNSSQNTQIEYH